MAVLSVIGLIVWAWKTNRLGNKSTIDVSFEGSDIGSQDIDDKDAYKDFADPAEINVYEDISGSEDAVIASKFNLGDKGAKHNHGNHGEEGLLGHNAEENKAGTYTPPIPTLQL